MLAGSMPVAYRIGDLIYAPGIIPADLNGRITGDFEDQLDQALQNMKTMLREAGTTLENVAHVTVYFKDVTWRPRLNTVWERWFPDPNDRPPHKYVPIPFDGVAVTELQVYAFAGARRQVLKIPGVQHQDPMTMGVKIAGHIFSSRLFAGSGVQGIEAQTDACLTNMDRLLENGGVTRDALTQVKAFVKDPADASVLADRLKGSAVALDVLVTDLPGLGLRLEIIGTA